MKRLLIASLALALTSCAGLGSIVSTPPAPLSHTSLDEKAINLALKSADAIATAVDLLVAVKQIVPGTPRALNVKRGLLALRDGLVAASAAQRAGNATSYEEALRNAEAALAAVQSALK
jgi:hypothetical protein